jgi:hypothetical protein
MVRAPGGLVKTTGGAACGHQLQVLSARLAGWHRSRHVHGQLVRASLTGERFKNDDPATPPVMTLSFDPPVHARVLHHAESTSIAPERLTAILVRFGLRRLAARHKALSGQSRAAVTANAERLNIAEIGSFSRRLRARMRYAERDAHLAWSALRPSAAARSRHRRPSRSTSISMTAPLVRTVARSRRGEASRSISTSSTAAAKRRSTSRLA